MERLTCNTSYLEISVTMFFVVKKEFLFFTGCIDKYLVAMIEHIVTTVDDFVTIFPVIRVAVIIRNCSHDRCTGTLKIA